MTTQTASSAYSAAVPSRLLDALESAREHALKQEAISLVYESEHTQRGLLGPSTSGPLPPEQVHATLEQLDSVSDQIAVVQTWLRIHPELLFVLDKAIRDEYRQMERRARLMGLLVNALFTLIGAFIGYWLPIVIQWLSAPR